MKYLAQNFMFTALAIASLCILGVCESPQAAANTQAPASRSSQTPTARPLVRESAGRGVISKLTPQDKSGILIEAFRFQKKFRGKTFVVKLGGSLMDHFGASNGLMQDMAFMRSMVGVDLVGVHGGGKAINAELDRLGIKRPKAMKGLRPTNRETLDVVKRVLGGEVNGRIVDYLNDHGVQAESLTNDHVLRGRRVTEIAGEAVDLGYVGEVARVLEKPIRDSLSNGRIPIIPSLALDTSIEHDEAGLNVNADTAALGVARALKAEKLIFLSDQAGILASRDAVNQVIGKIDRPYADRILSTRFDENSGHFVVPTIDRKLADALIHSGVVNGGMEPKVRDALSAVEAGVNKVHIVDGRKEYPLLLELYTTDGSGTQFVRDRKKTNGSSAR